MVNEALSEEWNKKTGKIFNFVLTFLSSQK